MAHQRKLVRQAIVAALTGTTSAGQRVYDHRIDSIGKSPLPAISVYLQSEEVDIDPSIAVEPRELTRRAEVEVAGFVRHTDQVSAATSMDDLAEQIEAAMDVDRYFGGTCSESILESTELEVRQLGSDPLIGVVVLTYAVTYRTQPATPTDLDDFLRVTTTHQLEGGVVDTPPAIDEFTVQEAP